MLSPHPLQFTRMVGRRRSDVSQLSLEAVRRSLQYFGGLRCNSLMQSRKEIGRLLQKDICHFAKQAFIVANPFQELSSVPSAHL